MLGAALGHEEDAARAIAALCRTLAEGLCASDWIDGCPITTTSLCTAGRVPDIQMAATEAFARWRSLVHDKLRASGIGESYAHDLAHTVISAIEGAELTAQFPEARSHWKSRASTSPD